MLRGVTSTRSPGADARGPGQTARGRRWTALLHRHVRELAAVGDQPGLARHGFDGHARARLGIVRCIAPRFSGTTLAVLVTVTGDEHAHPRTFPSRGAGFPFVLAHGFTGSSLDSANVVETLAARRGGQLGSDRGHREPPNTGDAASYTFDQLVSDMAALVDSLALTRFDLLGHSMGSGAARGWQSAGPGAGLP